MKFKVIFFGLTMSVILVIIGWIFWEQEVKYALPTPVPANFVDTQIGQKIDLSDHIEIEPGRNTLLHFFSYSCACSRFNMKEFERLARKFKDSIDFYVVIQSSDEDDLIRFQDKYELQIPTILDKEGLISDACGIYATPQAVILNDESELYYKGNYNKARFCTRRETRYVDMALNFITAQKELPLDIQNMATQPYGCSLPSDEGSSLENEAALFNIFN